MVAVVPAAVPASSAHGHRDSSSGGNNQEASFVEFLARLKFKEFQRQERLKQLVFAESQTHQHHRPLLSKKSISIVKKSIEKGTYLSPTKQAQVYASKKQSLENNPLLAAVTARTPTTSLFLFFCLSSFFFFFFFFSCCCFALPRSSSSSPQGESDPRSEIRPRMHLPTHHQLLLPFPPCSLLPSHELVGTLPAHSTPGAEADRAGKQPHGAGELPAFLD